MPGEESPEGFESDREPPLAVKIEPIDKAGRDPKKEEPGRENGKDKKRSNADKMIAVKHAGHEQKGTGSDKVEAGKQPGKFERRETTTENQQV